MKKSKKNLLVIREGLNNMDFKYLEMMIAFVEAIIIAHYIIRSLEPIKFKRWSQLSYVILASLLFINVYYLSAFIHSESMTGIMQILICLLFSVLFLNGPIYKKILISMISNLLILLINVFVLAVLGMFLDERIMQIVNQQNAVWLFAVVMSKVLYFFIVCILLTVQNRTIYGMKFKESSTILFIFFITLFIGLSILEMNIVSGNYVDRYLFVSIIGLVLINMLAFYMISHISKENEKKMRYSLLEMQVENQKNDIKELQNSYSEMSKIRHDYKNYLLCGLTLIKENNITQAERYFSEILDEKLDSGIAYVHTANNAVNAIINAKLSKCKKLGITTHYEIVEKIDIDDLDISILFANLFDNAIEACAGNSHKSSIYLKVCYEKAYLNIILKNSIDESILSHNPKLITTKKDKKKHGYGLITVDDIVKKYDGIKQYYEKGNWFYADIWIKSPYKPEFSTSCQDN